MTKQTQTFQAETKELLNLMIHSLYSHPEIFLRELISNSADAIEKLKFESLTNKDLASSSEEFQIKLDPNTETQTLTITDNGIGMTREEMVQNLGTIAHSGTKSFLKMKEELQSKPDLIGQFGVGLYSAFIVADRVTVLSQKAGTTTATLWESDGAGTYSVEDSTRPEGHGTTITLHLKKNEKQGDASEGDDENTQDFTDTFTLKGLVKKYSDFVPFPIKLKDEVLNSQKALWLRSPSEVTPEEHSEFYKHLSHDWSEPLKTIHYRAEGTSEFSSILYIPSQKPFNYDFRDRKIGLNLYVKRIFIKGDCEELLPPYLRFVKGMVDSDDLSLNVSREILQQDREVTKIKRALTNKIQSTLKELLEQDRPNYEKFWTQFGTTLKEGVAGDPSTKEKLQDLMLFNTTANDQLTTLREYVARMKEGQKAIYYITGETLNQIKNSPYLEKLKHKNFEVLLMVDGIDGWVANNLGKYSDKPLQSIAAADLDLDTEEEKKETQSKLKEAEAKFKPLLETMSAALKEQVKEIKLSDRLIDSPVCLVSDQNGMSAHMERLLESMGQAVPKNKRTLELNPFHPLYEKMLSASKEYQQEWADILYNQALLNEGSTISDPYKYSQKIAKLMLHSTLQ